MANGQTLSLVSSTAANPDPIQDAYNKIDPADHKAIQAIEGYINSGSPPENSRIFTLSPAMARYLLIKYNSGNRPKKPSGIARYANDMKAGNWVVTGDTLKFSNKQRLRDGQNRLIACGRAGVPFRTHIVFGIEDQYFNRMDQGKNRDGADLLAIEGVQNAGEVKAAVRWAELFATGTVPQRTTFTPPETLDLYRKTYAGKIDPFVPLARRIKHVTQQPTGLIAGFLYVVDQKDRAAATQFATGWESARWTGKFQPFDKLQKRIKEIENAASGRVHETVRAALIVTAWNAFRGKGRKDKKAFEWAVGDNFPTIA